MLFDSSLGKSDGKEETLSAIEKKAEAYENFISNAYAELEKYPEGTTVTVVKTTGNAVYSYGEITRDQSTHNNFKKMVEQMEKNDDKQILYVTVLENKWSFSVLTSDCREALRGLHPENIHAENISLRLGSVQAF